MYKRTIVTLFFCFFILFETPPAAIHPDSVWVPVTFFDHSTRREYPGQENDFFFGDICCSVITGMVKDTLSSVNGHPVSNYPAPIDVKHKYLDGWWTAKDSSVDMYDVYELQDSILFIKDGSSPPKYFFDGADNFKPTDNWAMEPFSDDAGAALPISHDNLNNENTHRNGWAAHLHTSFVYDGDLEDIYMYIASDDDGWIFINKVLVVDRGGVHGTSAISYTNFENQLAPLGLTHGEIVDFDFFYAERNAGGVFKLKTNLPLAPWSGKKKLKYHIIR